MKENGNRQKMHVRNLSKEKRISLLGVNNSNRNPGGVCIVTQMIINHLVV